MRFFSLAPAGGVSCCVGHLTGLAYKHKKGAHRKALMSASQQSTTKHEGFHNGLCWRISSFRACSQTSMVSASSALVNAQAPGMPASGTTQLSNQLPKTKEKQKE
jgi:hypothetical protein